jgi:hypothetical protein
MFGGNVVERDLGKPWSLLAVLPSLPISPHAKWLGHEIVTHPRHSKKVADRIYLSPTD